MKPLLPLALILVLAGCPSEPGNSSSGSGSPPPEGPGRLLWNADRAGASVNEAEARFARDWQEAVVTDGGAQRLWLKNAVRSEVAGKPASAGDGAADVVAWIAFRPPEPGARPERELVEWFPVRDEPSEKSVDGTPGLAAQRGGRPLFTIHRRVWRLGDAEAGLKAVDERMKDGVPFAVREGDSKPVEAGKPRPSLSLLEDKVVAAGLVAWNIEVYDPDPNDPFVGLFVQMEDSKAFPQASMPIGAAAKPPALPRKLRVTGVVPDADEKGCGRVVQREAVRLE